MVVYLDYRGNSFFYFWDLLSLKFQLQILKQIFSFYTISVLARSCSGGPEGLIFLWLLHFALRQRGNSNITNMHLTVITRKQYVFFPFECYKLICGAHGHRIALRSRTLQYFTKQRKIAILIRISLTKFQGWKRDFLKSVWLFKY